MLELDLRASREIKELLLRFVKSGGTVFLTSHILEIVERLCDHLGVIHRGRLVAQGPMMELRAGVGVEKSLEEIFLGLVGAGTPGARVIDWLER